MKIEIWSLPDCERCERALSAIRDSGHEAVVCDLKAVRSADIRDVDVLTQVSLQNGYAPVLRIVGERTDDFIEPEHLLDWLERNRRLAAGDLRLAAPHQE